MIRVLLINPNTSRATTDRMVALAQAAAPPGVQVVGATAAHGPAMILRPAALAAAGAEVTRIGRDFAGSVAGMVVGAFGDPGLQALRSGSSVPTVGLAESAMLAAASGGRRFGVATVTPLLAGSIRRQATALGLRGCYTGIRVTAGDPMALAAAPARLVEALAQAVAACIGQDGAAAVIIGGGPLGDAAAALAPRFAVPVIAPIPAAIRHLMGLLHR